MILLLFFCILLLVLTQTNSESRLKKKCKHYIDYFVTNELKYKQCIGKSDQDMKDNRAITGVIGSRGYLLTCRVLHMLLWMKSQVDNNGDNGDNNIDNTLYNKKDYFLDIGMNIGTCSAHIASLGIPTIGIDPVEAHIDIIKGTKSLNPEFNMEIIYGGELVVI